MHNRKKVNFARTLMMYRQEAGMTALELSTRLGLARRTIVYWETAERLPDFISLIKLAEIFDVSLDEIGFWIED